jgi:hypothetical protein
VAVLGVGALTATAGNSANAKLCQKNGWTNLVRADGTAFANEAVCVSYGAQGGAYKPKPTCIAGSENFSGDAVGSQPTTFSGGTIDTAYGIFGGVHAPPLGGFTGNSLFSGESIHGDLNLFKLTFGNAVGSVRLDAESEDVPSQDTNLTLTGYDSSGNVVGTETEFEPMGSDNSLVPLSIEASGNKITYFTIATDGENGLHFSNIVWGCAA